MSKANRDLLRQVSELEASGAIMSERLQYAKLASREAKAKLSEQTEFLKQAEAAKTSKDAELIQLRTRVAVQVELLATLKLAFPQSDTGVNNDGNTVI